MRIYYSNETGLSPRIHALVAYILILVRWSGGHKDQPNFNRGPEGFNQTLPLQNPVVAH